MATIFTDIEGILSDIEFIVSLAANEERLASEVKSLSGISVPYILTTSFQTTSANELSSAFGAFEKFSVLGTTSANALSSTFGAAEISSFLGPVSAYALGNVVSLLTPRSLLRKDAVQLSAVSVPTFISYITLPAVSGSCLASVYGGIEISSFLGVASANALGDATATLLPKTLLGTDLTQLAKITSADFKTFKAYSSEVTALATATVIVTFKRYLSTNPAQLNSVVDSFFNIGKALRGFPVALSTILPTELDTEKLLTSTLEQLSEVAAGLTSIFTISGQVDQLAFVDARLIKKIPISSALTSLNFVYGHFGHGLFIAATTATQLSSAYAFMKFGFALSCSSNALAASSSDLEIFSLLKETATQLSFTVASLDLEPYMHGSANSLSACSVTGITSVVGVDTVLTQLANVDALIRAKTTIKGTQVAQLNSVETKLTLAFTLDGSAAALVFVSASLTLKRVLNTWLHQLANAESDHLAILSRLIADDVRQFTTIGDTYLSTLRPMNTTVTALSDVFSLSTCTKIMRKTQATQLSDVVLKLTTKIAFENVLEALSFVYSDLEINSKLSSSITQWATSAPVLTEFIDFSAEITNLTTIAGSLLKPTKRLPDASADQLSGVFGDIQNNWTGLYAKEITQLSAASVLKIATKVLLLSTAGSLATGSGTKILPHITLDTNIYQLTDLTGEMGRHREIAGDITQLSDVTGLVNLFKSMSADASQLSDSSQAVVSTIKKLVGDITQLSDATSAASCIKRFTAEASALSGGFGHLYSDTTFEAEVTQLSFVNAQLQSQMKASATQLAVTQGRIRGSTFGRVYKPTLELYTG